MKDSDAKRTSLFFCLGVTDVVAHTVHVRTRPSLRYIKSHFSSSRLAACNTSTYSSRCTSPLSLPPSFYFLPFPFSLLPLSISFPPLSLLSFTTFNMDLRCTKKE